MLIPLRITGVFDRWMESTAEASFGRLAYDAELVVPPQSYGIPNTDRTSSPDTWQFHHRPAINFIEKVLNVKTDGSDYFLIVVLNPLHWQRSPQVCTLDEQM